MSATNIILIGFMGSGKSYIGKKLARELDKSFFDTDTLIEQGEGRRIDELFELKGEAYFRECEQKLVDSIIDEYEECVISTGGGLPIYCNNLNKAGKIVYLQIGFESILSRMDEKELNKRPLFKDVQKAKEIYSKRVSVYEQKADVIIDADAKAENIIEEIKTKLSA